MPLLLTPSAPLLFRFSIEERNCFFDPAFPSFAWVSSLVCLESFCALLQRYFRFIECTCLSKKKIFMATHPCVFPLHFGCFMAHLCFAALDCVPSTRLSLVAPFALVEFLLLSLHQVLCLQSLSPQIVSCWSLSIPSYYSHKLIFGSLLLFTLSMSY